MPPACTTSRCTWSLATAGRSTTPSGRFWARLQLFLFQRMTPMTAEHIITKDRITYKAISTRRLIMRQVLLWSSSRNLQYWPKELTILTNVTRNISILTWNISFDSSIDLFTSWLIQANFVITILIGFAIQSTLNRRHTGATVNVVGYHCPIIGGTDFLMKARSRNADRAGKKAILTSVDKMYIFHNRNLSAQTLNHLYVCSAGNHQYSGSCHQQGQASQQQDKARRGASHLLSLKYILRTRTAFSICATNFPDKTCT